MTKHSCFQIYSLTISRLLFVTKPSDYCENIIQQIQVEGGTKGTNNNKKLKIVSISSKESLDMIDDSKYHERKGILLA